MLPARSSFASIVASTNAGELKTPYAGFLWIVDNQKLHLPIPPAPAMKTLADFPSRYEYTKWLQSLFGLAGGERVAIEYLAYAGKFTGDPKYDAAALAHLMGMASWSPTGATGDVNADLANLEASLGIAQGLDLLGDTMTSADRAIVIASLRNRIGQTMNRLVSLDNQPNDSHLIEDNVAVMQSLTLVAGVENFPEANEWLARSWETMITTAPVWGGADGSWGNSGAYGWFRMGRVTDMMAEARLATGVDLMKWPVFGKFGDTQIAQYAPIYIGGGAPSLRGSFGDGVENSYFYSAWAANTYRLFAKLTAKPSDEWYWRVGTPSKIQGNGIPAINFMMLGLNLPAVTPAAPTNDSYAFEDSGIAALHSSTGDPLRTSLFFRSSRLGALNHSHADS
ncbi:MAG: DUF4962 domain-containing protein, partial [Candidatus Nitrotoga sp.]|nr:DUF4962 domain-containing protein [Candidatus Nitrotoga sp.]